MPTIRQLQYLVALDDLKHFGRAAVAVNVSQPTLSQQLRALEARLGTVLVERGSSTVSLTPIGRDISQRARSVLMQVDDIKAFAQRSQGEMSGTIRFGVSPTLGPYLMPEIISLMHQQFPNIKLYIREGISTDQVHELSRGGLDMVLASLPVTGADLYVEPLFRETLHLVAPPDHPLALKDVLNKVQLKGAPILSLDPRHHLHGIVEQICNDLGAELLRDYEGSSLDSLCQMTGSGLGISVMPELYLRSEVGGRNVVKRLNVAGWSSHRSIAAVWRRGAAFTEHFAKIADLIGGEARRTLNNARPSFSELQTK